MARYGCCGESLHGGEKHGVVVKRGVMNQCSWCDDDGGDEADGGDIVAAAAVAAALKTRGLGI